MKFYLKSLVVAAVAVGVVQSKKNGKNGDGGGVSALGSCGVANNNIVAQDNRKCVNMDQPTSIGSVSTCCASENLFDDSRGDGSESCRSVTFDGAYCENPDDCDLTHNDVLRINLDIHSVAQDASCCQKCQCYGDPECVSFNGDRDEWVLCDARHPNSCDYSKQVCGEQLDHEGESCKWIRGSNLWKGWQKTGSPCQPDWTRDGFEWPTMLMHKRGDFSLSLTLGERGIISRADMTTSAGSFYLTSDACWEDGAAAWVATSGSQPGTWTSRSVTNDKEILWTVSDESMDIHVEIICARFGREKGAATRLDIRGVLETNFNGQMEGFCSSGSINDKAGSTNETEWKHEYCTEKSLPSMSATCKAIMGKGCGKKYMDDIEFWCENADLGNTPAENSAMCYDMLTEGGEEESVVAWTEFICAVNQVERLECMSKIGQFGWEDFFDKYSNGIVANTGPDSCATSVNQYGVNTESCATGISVEYFKDGEWIQYVYIPSDSPPCNNELVVYGDDKDAQVLFQYPIRFSQCDTSTTCLSSNGCKPSQGFDVSLNYATNNCPVPTRAPTPRAPTLPKFGCFTCDESDQTGQFMCDGASEPQEMGACDSCCMSELLFNPTPDGFSTCRELTLDSPYCDLSIEDELFHERCLKLPKSDATLTFDFEVETDNDETSCCNHCTCFGDPFCIDFNGNKDKWILCDARQPSCWVDEYVCSTQRDHMGNECKWNQKKFDLLQKKGRAAIGSVGSPCQADWEKSGDAWMTMYSAGGTSIDLAMGERAVIERVRFTTKNGEFTLVADDCFGKKPMDAWDTSDVEDHLDISWSNGNNNDERRWTIADPETRLFVHALCIRQKTKGVKDVGYRINVEDLIEIDTDRAKNSNSGFCARGSIEKGLATTNVTDAVIDKCSQGFDDSLLVCRSLWKYSCINSEIAQGAASWCIDSNYPGGADACMAVVGDGSNANKWIYAYCKSLYVPGNGASESIFVEQCVSRIEVDGIESYVDEFGDGTFSTNGLTMCGTSELDYDKEADNQCTNGISIEYKKGGIWIPELFVPANFQPCNGKLEITAKNHPNLFFYPIRTRQCAVDTEKCPVDVSCSKHLAFNVKYLFQAPEVCTAAV